MMRKFQWGVVLGLTIGGVACLDDHAGGVEDAVDTSANGDTSSDMGGESGPDSTDSDSASNDTRVDDTTADDTGVSDTGVSETTANDGADDTNEDDTALAETDADTVSNDTNTNDTADVPPLEELPLFSFFVTSIEAMRELSGSENGFGGDLRFGEATGLAGADKICATIAEKEMPGASQKRWRAFLSVSDDGNGNTVHAIDRVGTGPWYDRNGRLVAQNVAGLGSTRPAGETQVKNDLPNERGESQKTQPGPNANGYADNHDVLTGSNSQGRLENASAAYTCNNWTSTGSGRPRLGHSWPANSGQGWIQAHPAAGCQALVNITNNGPGDRDCQGVGCGGGYGAIYCFAEVP